MPWRLPSTLPKTGISEGTHTMSDLDLTKTNFAQNQDTASSKNLKDQAADAGTELKQRAGDALRASTDVAREKFKEAADAAKDTASGAVDQFKSQAREQQRSGADFVERLAGNMREAGRAFESDVPFAARGIGSAADYVEEAAQKIRDGSFRDLVEGATDFAKRQPAAFLGISVLAGFAAVRFLKASGEQSSSSKWSGTVDKSSSEDAHKSRDAPFSARDETWPQGSARPGSSSQQTSSSQGNTVP